MPNFNLENYAPVEDRIAQFYADHPQGCIQTELAKMDGPMVVFWAKVYRNPEEVAADVFTSGWAMEVEGKSPVNRTSHLENCETSAVGRALANLNYPGSIDGSKAPRPSREEMSKAQSDAPRPQLNGQASEKQIEFIRKLAKSSTFTDEQRERLETRISGGLSKQDASDILESLQAKIGAKA